MTPKAIQSKTVRTCNFCEIYKCYMSVLSCVVFHHIWQFCGLKVGILGTKLPKLPANKTISNWFLFEFMIAKCAKDW